MSDTPPPEDEAAADDGFPDQLADGGSTDQAAGGDRAHEVLAYLAAQLVDDHDAIDITSEPLRNGGTKLLLRVAADDMGRVIGRRGRVAQSIRGVVRAAGASEGRDVVVDIVD